MLLEDEDVAHRVAAPEWLADVQASMAARLKIRGGWPFMILDVSDYRLLGRVAENADVVNDEIRQILEG
jgi:hypothetical protein